jgi:tartrate dehydratase alpha subunit/fumarate hydratase class I-like protein
MSATIETTLRQAVEDAAAELYVWSLKDIPADLRAALGDALERETHTVGRRILQTIHTNVAVADEGKRLVCQDTGIAVYYARVGERFPLHPARIEEALREGTRRATLDHPLRSNTVHTLTREPTGDNTGHRIPHVHWEFVPDWDGLDIKCVPKGSGSEKEAIARPVGTRNPDPEVARLERELFDLLNETGVGPMGLGGDTTVLSVHVEQAHTHITLNPVAVNYQCWAARRATAHVTAAGQVDLDRDA